MNLQVIYEQRISNKNFAVYGTFENPLFLAKDVAEWIEYVGRTGQMLATIDEDEKLTHKIYASGQSREMWFLTEDGLYEVLMQSTKPIAKQFKKQVKAILKEIRKTGSYTSSTNENHAAFEAQLIGVKYAAEILQVDTTSKIKMLAEAHKCHGVPTNHLPAYVDEEVTKSLTTLLKEYDIKLGAAKVNTKLIELGLLEIKERPSSKGGVKEFKSLTKEGLYYGKNFISPNNQKETQPHYYPSKFTELLKLIGEL